MPLLAAARRKEKNIISARCGQLKFLAARSTSVLAPLKRVPPLRRVKGERTYQQQERSEIRGSGSTWYNLDIIRYGGTETTFPEVLLLDRAPSFLDPGCLLGDEPGGMPFYLISHGMTFIRSLSLAFDKIESIFLGLNSNAAHIVGKCHAVTLFSN